LDGDEQPYIVTSEGTDTLLMDNAALETQHSDGQVGVTGHARLTVKTDGGDSWILSNQLIVSQAHSATINKLLKFLAK
jgi:hypothetical protein